tara:strand:+ start:1158 stop:1754 length:597 start_codon:yes stop_codon:yes gene_type:complete
MTFGRRPTYGFISRSISPSNYKQKNDCCQIAKSEFIENFKKITNEYLTKIAKLGKKTLYLEHLSDAKNYLLMVQNLNCREFKEMLKNFVSEKGYDEMKPLEILNNWKRCEQGQYSKDFQELNLSEDITIWQDSLYKEEDTRLTKKLYEIVRDEMYSPDVLSIEDLYKKVMARWDEVAKPTKEQVQKVMGYILTRGRIR